MNLKKVFFVVLGCLSLGLGALGAVLPLLPAFPFLMLAAFCFAKSSEKLHGWFVSTKLYKKNLESFVTVWEISMKCFMRMRLPRQES